LIVVSDGGDNASVRTYAEVLALARRSNAVIYAMGLVGTPPAEEDGTWDCSSGTARTRACCPLSANG
jgi:hypothetical protein